MLFSQDDNGQKHLVECASKTLNDAERKWVTAEKEAYAIVWALKHWGCYLRGRRVTVITDHKNLQWMFEKSNGKLHHWSMLLSEFYLDIKHRSGKLMCHVDCLSRNPHEDLIEDRMVLSVTESEQYLDTIVIEYCFDPGLCQDHPTLSPTVPNRRRRKRRRRPEVKCRDYERPLSPGAPSTRRKFREGMIAGYARQLDLRSANRGRSIASGFQPTFTTNKTTCAPRVHSNNQKL